MDFGNILTGLAAASAVSAIISAGAIKASPGFARWATNKVATFFR
ncbi:capsid protein [Stenotrophomonas maltophilia]|nr:capsid protein [Stenotrophomonas maltophilia]